jgi:hypothetical protein
MLPWGFRVLAALLDPALLNPGLSFGSSSLALGLAVVAAVVLLALFVPAPAPPAAPGVVAFARRARTAVPPRLIDPDAAGRPRPRAPSVCPAA